jgi:hypothetical protein
MSEQRTARTNSRNNLDLERLENIFTLEPRRVYEGLHDFREYLAFEFDSNLAILDSPIVGNALYLLRGDWRELSRLSKSELLQSHLALVTRLVHKGDWFGRAQRQVLMAQGRRAVQ